MYYTTNYRHSLMVVKIKMRSSVVVKRSQIGFIFKLFDGKMT